MGLPLSSSTSRSLLPVGMLCLVGCAHRGAPVAATTGNELMPRDAFVCESGQTVSTQYDSAQKQLALSIDDSFVRLAQVPSASGAKFSDGQITFWSHGDDATLEIDGVTTGCHREFSG